LVPEIFPLTHVKAAKAFNIIGRRPRVTNYFFTIYLALSGMLLKEDVYDVNVWNLSAQR
jgi:hypothetical protein